MSKRLLGLAVQTAAVGLGIVASAVILAVTGESFSDSLSTLFHGAFGTSFALQQTTLKAVPLALCGLAVALPLRMRLWNIGAEGQFHAGAIGASWVAIAYPGLPRGAMLALTLLAALGAGAAWALLAAIPRALWGVNEIITTLLLNYVAIQLLAYLVTGPLQGKQSFNFPVSDPFSASFVLPAVGGSLIHVGIFFPLAGAAFLLLVLHATKWGYEVKMIGASPGVARVVGMSEAKNVLVVMAGGGALAGVAGMVEVANTFGRLQQGISPGYGYMAIVIAALAGADLVGTLVVAFLFGGFVVGGLALQTRGVPQAFVLMLQGIVLFCAIGGARLAGLRLTPLRPRREGAASTP